MNAPRVWKPILLPSYQKSLTLERAFQDSVRSQNTSACSISLQWVVFRWVRVEIFLEKVGRMYISNVKCNLSWQENAKHIPINITPTFCGLCFLSKGHSISCETLTAQDLPVLPFYTSFYFPIKTKPLDKVRDLLKLMKPWKLFVFQLSMSKEDETLCVKEIKPSAVMNACC